MICRDPSPSTREGGAVVVAALGEGKDDGLVVATAIANDANRYVVRLSIRRHNEEIVCCADLRTSVTKNRDFIGGNSVAVCVGDRKR